MRVPLFVTPFPTEQPLPTATRIVVVNLAALSLQQLGVRRLSRTYLSPLSVFVSPQAGD